MSPDRRMNVAQWLGWALAGAALLALGALWRYDRVRAWESPRWDDARLAVLRGAASGSGAVETWAVAVNPECARCRASLGRVLAIRALAIRALGHAPVRISALVVDTARRPSSPTLAALPADELRWDSTGTWRHRWGHRVYGELLCFDRSGRFLRTLAPLGDSIADRRARRLIELLGREGGS